MSSITHVEPSSSPATERDASALSPDADLRAVIRRLTLENASLRCEVKRLSTFRSMAYRDSLTGLHNRRYFDERLREESARAQRCQAYAFSLIVVDIDDFKAVNDTLGHAVGDQVLVEASGFLLDNVREVDIVCRLGGDEFGILLPDTDEAGCRVVIERLRVQFKGLKERLPYPVGLSIGAAAHPPGPADPEGLMVQADTAMYLDKRRRKSQSRTRRPARTPRSAGILSRQNV